MGKLQRWAPVGATIAVALLLAFGRPVSAQPAPPAVPPGSEPPASGPAATQKTRVAILPLLAFGAEPVPGDAMSARLVDQANTSADYTGVLARSSRGPCAEPECAVEAAKSVGASAALYVRVTELDAQHWVLTATLISVPDGAVLRTVDVAESGTPSLAFVDSAKFFAPAAAVPAPQVPPALAAPPAVQPPAPTVAPAEQRPPGGRWALTLDVPVAYTFDQGNANKPAQGSSPAPWKSRMTTDVSGAMLLALSPFHVGLGYENYSVTQSVIVGSGNGNVGGGGSVGVATKIQMVDLVADFPTRILNFTLGYGMGSADTSFTITSMNGGNNNNNNNNGGIPSPIHANASQVFFMVGVPLGSRFDIHLAYHFVTIAQKDIIVPGNNPPFDKSQLSGEALTLGARLNF